MNLKIVETPDGLQSLKESLAGLGQFAFDTETTGLDWTKSAIFLLSFSDGETSWVIPVNRFHQKVLSAFLEDVFDNPRQRVIGHNLKFDAHQLKQSFGVTIHCEWHDTLLMAYMLDENRSNAMKRLMEPLLGLVPADEAKIHGWMKEHQGNKDNWDFSKVPEGLMLPYSGMDPFATYKLYEKLRPEIDLHFKDLYETDRQVLKILWKMEQNGLLVDRERLQTFEAVTSATRDGIAQGIFTKVGREFSLTADEDLRKVFYEDLKLPVLFFTEKEKLPAVNEAALSVMDHEIAGYIQLWREQTNLLNYSKGLLLKQDVHGLVHADYSITRTKTGRFSCSDPNLQNVPKNSDLRRCFIADEGYDMFYFDHAQIEMVGFAHYSQDPKMMAALRGGQDLHALAASEVYGIPIEEITKDQRAVGKGTNFSIIYGVGKKRLASYINNYMGNGDRLTDLAAQQFKQKYFDRFPSVTKFQYQAQSAVKTRRLPWGHFIRNQFGRVRRLQDPQNKAYTAVNHLIQGWAPDLMKQAMVKIENSLHPKWKQNVHDELRIDVPFNYSSKETKEWVGEIVQHLTTFPEVRVPIKCKVEWSEESWASLKPYA